MLLKKYGVCVTIALMLIVLGGYFMDATSFYLGADGRIRNDRAENYVKILSVSRERDRVSGMERLRVDIFDKQDDKVPYAVAYCSPLTLRDDLHRLRVYGVVAKRQEVMEMARTLEEKYHELTCTVVEGARTLESDMDGILRHICEFIRANGIEVRTINNFDVYGIAVKDFGTLFKDSPYARYSNTAIRKKLRDMECTVSNANRYDYTVKETGSNEPVKIIAINADAPEVADTMQDLENDE